MIHLSYSLAFWAGTVLLLLLGWAWVLRNAEKSMAKSLKAEASFQVATHGLDRALWASVYDLEPAGRFPQVRVFADPLPRAQVTRALGGTGTVFLSRGLIALLSEDELLAVLRRAFLLSKTGGLVRKSGFAACAAFFSRRMAVDDRKSRVITPWVAVKSWIFLPPALLFTRASRDLDLFGADVEAHAGGDSARKSHWLSATRKISRAQRLHLREDGLRYVL